ncbi:MAG: hypothetical protein ACXV7F_00035 [Methylomonas sp.]
MQLIKAAFCQILACVIMLLLGPRLSGWGLDVRLIPLVQAVIAAALSALLHQPPWWRIIHLFFMPAVAILLAMNLPSWLYLLIFLLLTLVFWGTAKGDVPLFLSSSAVSDALATIVVSEQATKFADIGAGIGTIVEPLAQKLPELRIDALERAPLPWLFAFWRCRKLPNVQVRYASLWTSNLGEYDVVFAFLSPMVMERIGEKVLHDMREDSLFVSSSFPIPGWLSEAILEIDDRQKTRLYCYRIPSKSVSTANIVPIHSKVGCNLY